MADPTATTKRRWPPSSWRRGTTRLPGPPSSIPGNGLRAGAIAAAVVVAVLAVVVAVLVVSAWLVCR